MDETTNSESEKILQEAAAIAESSVGDRFPSMPANIRTSTKSKFF